MLGLNRQCMDHPGTTWHVVIAVENEPLSRSVCYEPDGTEITAEVRRIHVIRPAQGGRGDCRHCPAGDLTCAKADWSNQAQDRAVGSERDDGLGIGPTMFLSIDGGDGTGKSTQVQRLCDWLRGAGQEGGGLPRSGQHAFGRGRARFAPRPA